MPVASKDPSSRPYAFDGFLSYRSQTEYGRARWLESFLEGLHRLEVRRGAPLRPLQICRDGSDFRLPARRDAGDADGEVWRIIEAELARSRHLLVLCSPGAPSSAWMTREITWFLERRPDDVLLVIVEARDPVAHPEECFPAEIIGSGLHTSRLWYDLRGRERRGRRPGVRDWEDEAVRLAADLLDWDATAGGPLWGIYEREQLRVRRRQARWISGAAIIGLILAAVAGWSAFQSSRQAKRARANAIVSTAQTSTDPLAAALMLLELDDEPARGVGVARAIAAQHLATAELRGARAAVAALQFVRGSTQIAAVSDDGFIQLWDASGRSDVRRSPHGVDERPQGLASVDDGRLLATAARDGAAIVWSPGDDRTWRFDVPGNVESIVAFAGWPGPFVITESGKVFVLEPDHALRELLPAGPAVGVVHAVDDELLIADRDGALWTLAMRGGLRKVPGATPAVASDYPFNGPRLACFSADGHWYAVAFQDRLLVRNVHDPSRVLQLDYGSSISSLAFDAASRRIAAAGSSGLIAVWSLSSGEKREFDSRIRFWALANGIPSGAAPESFGVEAIAFSPSSPDVVAAVTADSVVRLWDARGGNPEEYRGHVGADALAWAPDGRSFATGADIGTVRVWTVAERRDPVVLQHGSPVESAGFLADGRLVSLTRDGVLRELAPDAGTESVLPAFAAKPTRLATDPGRTRVVVGFADGSVHVADGTPLAWTQSIPMLQGSVTHLVLRADHVLAVASTTAATAELQTASVRPLTTRGSAIGSVDLSADGKDVALGYDDGVLVRQLVGGRSEELHGADGTSVFGVSYSPGAPRLVTCSQNGTAILYLLGSRTTQRQIDLPSNGEWLESCAFSPDGRHVVVTGESGRAWLTDDSGRSPVALVRANGVAHVGSILGIGFSADAARVLLVGGVDGAATLWDVASASLLAVLTGHAGTVIVGEISADGRTILTASEDASVRLWSADWQSLRDRLARRTTATLNPEQRMTDLGESDEEARKSYRREEQAYGRRGDSYGPFRYPF